MYEQVLGRHYQTWVTQPKCHRGLDELLVRVLKNINQKHRIRLGAIGFEVSGMYYLEALRQQALVETSNTKLFVNSNEMLAPEIWTRVVSI